MNYGYAEEQQKSLPSLQPEDEPFRYPIQLYAHVVGGTELRHKDVIEVGCGRGGGGSFLIRYFSPRSFTGIDLSPQAIEWCRRRMSLQNARWLQGSADALPVPNCCADVVVNVESSHCYPSVPQFLAEVRRVLRPGGRFLFCDMRTANRVSELDRHLSDSGLNLLRRVVVTPQVVRALDRVSQQREQQIKLHVPALLRRALRDLVAVKNTPVYTMLANGEMVYLSYALERPE